MALINATTLERIARVFGEGDAPRTESHLEEICRVCGIEIVFTDEEETWRTLFEALNKRQFHGGDRRAILAFLRVAMQPERYRDHPGAFAALREQLNGHLVSCDIRIDEDGSLKAADSSFDRSTIPTWDLAVSSYIRAFRNIGLVVRISWAPILAGFLFAANLGVAAVWFGVPPVMQNPLVLYIISEFVFIPFAAIVLVAWHRYILLNETPKGSWFYFRISKRELLFALAVLAFLAMRLPQFATGLGYQYLMLRKAALGGVIDQSDIRLALVVSLSWLIFLVPVYARLLWALPEIAIDKGFNLRRCWRLTRGNTWRLAMGLVLVSVPFWGLLQVAEGLFVPSGITQVFVEVLLAYIVGLLGAATTATYISLTYEFANAAKARGSVSETQPYC